MPTVYSKQEELVWDGMHETEAKFQELLECCQVHEYMRRLTDEEVFWMKKVSDGLTRQNVYDRGDNVFRHILRESQIRDHEEINANFFGQEFETLNHNTVEIKHNKLMIIIWRHIHTGNKVKALEKIKKVQVIQLKSLEEMEEGKISFGVLIQQENGRCPRVSYRGKAGLDENVRRYGEVLRLERIQLDNWMRLTC